MSVLNPTAVSHEPTGNSNIIGVLALGVMIAVGLVFFHSNRASLLINLIHSWGSFGVILAVLTMVGVCTNSIPAEGLLIILLKVFGPVLGGLYGWCGAVLASLIVFVLAQNFVAPIYCESACRSPS